MNELKKYFLDFRKSGTHGGMILTEGKNEELGEKPVPVPLCRPQIPLD
jgi:hypothetical protein